MSLTNNPAVLSWIDEMTKLTKPDNIVWITGETEQLEQLREQAVADGTLIKLNQEKLPGCYLHRTDPDDVARVEDRTYICCKNEADAGPTNHWMDPRLMYSKLYAMADGAYQGRTMYVIPYSMSIVGSPFAKYGFELTDSIYVVLNMQIMTRIGQSVCDALGDDTGFIKGLHCQCNLDPKEKYIVHFPEDNTIISMNSNYGGNVLQGKKCFALRIASNLGRQEGWMAEHMLILGIENPRGKVRYITAAFPSACGKTNLAMLIPPEGILKEGWKVWCVGDDIAWLRVGPDGRLWAVNPENGFFGVAPGTSMDSNPNALKSCKLVFIMFFGLHENVGDDYEVYRSLYETLTLGDMSTFEPGFVLFAWCFKMLNLPFWCFLLGCSCLINGLLFAFLWRSKDNIPFVLCIFLAMGGVMLEMTYLRSTISLMIFANSIVYLQSKKATRYIALNSIGLLFHYSSILYLALYSFLPHKFSQKSIAIIMLFAFVFSMFHIPLLAPLAFILGQYHSE
ncbi:MAG: phosphoenolpyruvate carboxykinase (GTP), partial [Oscillospiraceae bacterium]|nr:phosphoenolpyruvate carboxykinase (GTP) [Oscillospiraceae bacterium]